MRFQSCCLPNDLESRLTIRFGFLFVASADRPRRPCLLASDLSSAIVYIIINILFFLNCIERQHEMQQLAEGDKYMVDTGTAEQDDSDPMWTRRMDRGPAIDDGGGLIPKDLMG